MVEGKKRVVGWDGSSFLSFSSAVVCREKLERERERERNKTIAWGSIVVLFLFPQIVISSF